MVSTTPATNPAWTVNGVLLYFNGTPAELKTTLYTITTAKTDGDREKILTKIRALSPFWTEPAAEK